MKLADETAAWDATETAQRIAAGEISAVEASRAAIARAEAWEPRIGAIAHRDFESGLRRAESPEPGVFSGVPTFVKDLEDLAGTPTRFGSAAAGGGGAMSATADSVRQFLSTGAVALGKSTTAEFGLTCTVEPTGAEPTRNPLALDYSTGGSSGGAAALVAAGVVPISHGGDGGGSIRIPAAFCGLVGLKATRGRLVDMESTTQMPVKIATYGVLTRSVRDTAAFFAAAGDQGNARDLPPIGHVEGPSDDKLRIGLFIDPPMGGEVDPEVRATTEAVARTLESMGHSVEPAPAPYDQQLVDDFLLHWALLAQGVELMVLFSKGKVKRLEPWTRGLAGHLRRNLLRVPGAIRRLRRFPASYDTSLASFDVLLSPTTAAPAPRIGHLDSSQPFESKLERLMELLPYTPVQNASGGPAISLPLGTSSAGLPIGVQLAAPRGHERRLLELAFALEGSSH